MELLQSYDFVARYRPGPTNIADPLTRKPEANLTVSSPEFGTIKAQLADSYKTDAYFGPIYHALTSPQDKMDPKVKSQVGRFQILNQFLFLKKAPHEDQARLCIPDKLEMKTTLLRNHHDAEIAGHQGVDKTYSSIAAHFLWPKLSKDVKSYIATYDACQRNKSSTRKPAGLLQPLPTSESRWEQVFIDFIVQLPKTKTGMTSILVVVDRLSKRAHFLPTTTEVTVPEVAKLFFNQIFRLHGLPQYIVSDCDPKFISKFWQELLKCTGVKTMMSTAHHPQTDGQTERTNRTLEDMLRNYRGWT